MANFFGSIDLTELGNIVRTHPELVRNIQMKDGTAHKFVNIDVYEKEQADQFGNNASIKVSVKKDQRKEGVKYYVANLKYSKYQGDQQPAPQPVQQQQPQQAQPPLFQQPQNDGLPF